MKCLSVPVTLFVLIAMTGAARSAQASVLLDQSLAVLDQGWGSANTETGATRAQTFTVGISGELAQLDFVAKQNGAAVSDVRVDVFSVVDDLPSASLGFVIVPGSALPSSSESPQIVSADVSSLHLAVQTGDKLALGLSAVTANASILWLVTVADLAPYPGGKPFLLEPGNPEWQQQINADHLFQTWVSVPEPGSLMLASFALLTLGVCGRRSLLTRYGCRRL